jgi:predicted amidohydrolase
MGAIGKPKIALVQLECKISRSAGNMKRAERYISRAIEDGAQLVCLPESFLSSGNILEVAEVAEHIPGPCTERLCTLAREGGIYIAAGLLEKDGAAHYSTSFLISPAGEIIGRYRRVHCFGLEKQYIRTGREFPVFATELGRIGLLQGYDLNFPESCRELCRQGVDIIICSALIPEQFTYITKQLLPARVIESQCYLLFVSGIGANPFAGFSYMGCSEILADPLFLEHEKFDFADGDEHMLVMQRDEAYATIELDVERLRKYRQGKSMLADLEPETYWQPLQTLSQGAQAEGG